MTSRLLSLAVVVALLGCHESSSSSSDGSVSSADGSIELPAECRAAPGPALHAVTFSLHNDGTRSVFLATDYSCGFTAAVTSSGSVQDLLWHGGILCPCTGECPVGGAGCGPMGKELAPGAHDMLTWQPSVAVQVMRDGNTCGCNTRNLPAGRYHFSARTFATATDATAGMPVLFTIDRDFDLPAPGDAVDVPVVAP